LPILKGVSGRPRTGLITGASRGLGGALAEAIPANGEQLIATARRPQDLAELAARHPGRVETLALAA
jgi:short-subunit dehydrogenase